VYKALYRLFGGYVADVVAAIDQVYKNIIHTHTHINLRIHGIVPTSHPGNMFTLDFL